MASAELQRASVNEPIAEVQEADISKISLSSHSFEPKLSAIVEENGTSGEELSRTTNPQTDRLEQLSHPKLLHLEETLERFKNITKDHETNERIIKIKMRLREIRGSEKYVRQIQTGNSSTELSRNTEVTYSNLQAKLRKAAFEILVKQIFDRIPQLLVEREHTCAQEMATEMKALRDTLQATLIYYLGQPANEHEKRIFNHLCYGLAQFIENIIENVHKNAPESERADQEGKSGNGQFTLAVQLARKAYIERP
ncbi:uncharacterized protein LOC128717873 [Anopheles marshallii]|uniref:uncharacterized protein LOC128717873 n=1 Tax=Anopheles marshallii TaxID=1521116 RepID=UPI00237AE715|nr:uncharacterized protein LOC128717873 [Anopheles marshallii]